LELGLFAPDALNVTQYSNVVWKSIPLAWSAPPSSSHKPNALKRNKNNFSQESVAVDVALAAYMTSFESSAKNGHPASLHTVSGSAETNLDLDLIKN
jgi:hypothetical protein